MDTVDLPVLPSYLFEPSLAGALSLVLAVLLPLVVGLITRPSTPSHWKGVALLAVAAVKSVIEAFLAGGADFNFPLAIYTVAINFGIAVASYFGLLRGSPPSVHAQNSLVKDK